MTLDTMLDGGLAALTLRADASARERLLAYLQLLEKWNKVYNLTAVRDIDAMMTHHLFDSLAVVPHLVGATVVDVGSGAGLPGVPIAIMRPDMRVTLLDSNHKKTAFLQQAAIELALDNATVVCNRAESWRPAHAYDVVISRAFAELSQFVATAGHLCSDDGVIIAMKGVYPDEELAAVPPGYRLVGVRRIAVPGLAADRHLVLLQPTAVAAEGI
jgi:16S rRNA (guanine527-N7)-methyltransferase